MDVLNGRGKGFVDIFLKCSTVWWAVSFCSCRSLMSTKADAHCTSPGLRLTDGRPVVPAVGGGVLEVLDEHAGEAEGDVVVLGARQDRREALLVGRREVGAAPQQQLRRLDQAAGRRQVQRAAWLLISRGFFG